MVIKGSVMTPKQLTQSIACMHVFLSIHNLIAYMAFVRAWFLDRFL